MHAHTTLASPSVPGLPSSCLQLHPSASLWRFVHLAVQEAVQEALVVQKFSLATGTQPLRPRPPGPERIQLSPTPTPSVPSPADFPAEAGGGAVQGEGTASGGGCLRVCEQFKFRREISGDNPGPGWLSSTGNLELGDSCGPRGGAAAPSNRTERPAQSFGLLDPKLCYLLDGILFIYGVIVTALFLRAKVGAPGAPAYQQGQNPVYNELNVGRREEYAVLDRRGGFDPEKGGKPRKKNPNEVVYNELRKDKMAEAYSEIGMKSDNQRRRGKGHDGLYQGLSTATKDTYDALHMQALPPR
nr:PREDICTED: T-cell surface glycoprotein CD3 zeta chain [Bos mutus]